MSDFILERQVEEDFFSSQKPTKRYCKVMGITDKKHILGAKRWWAKVSKENYIDYDTIEIQTDIIGLHHDM